MNVKFVSAFVLSACFAGISSATTILIDFGPASTTGTEETWNNFTGTLNNSSIANLRDTANAPTGYAITLTGGNVGTNSLNPTSPTNVYNPFTPATVLSDFIFIDSARTLTLTGLQPGVLYDLTFFAYAGGRATTRETSFTISGYTPLVLEPSRENSIPTGGQVGTISQVSPDGTSIAITVNLTPFNTTDSGSPNWILSGMAINYTVPEPSGVLLSAIGLLP